MANQPKIIYWDSNVFISMFSETVGRIDVIMSILDEAYNSNGAVKIVTSVLSKAEVVFVESESVSGVLVPDTEKRIEDFWNDDSVIELVEIHEHIIQRAKRIMRDAKSGGYKTPKPADAIHLATAIIVGATELQTYNIADFDKAAKVAGVTVCEPYIIQPPLPLQGI